MVVSNQAQRFVPISTTASFSQGPKLYCNDLGEAATVYPAGLFTVSNSRNPAQNLCAWQRADQRLVSQDFGSKPVKAAADQHRTSLSEVPCRNVRPSLDASPIDR